MQSLGRSRGGFSTKIHLLTDSHGNPLDFVLTGGQASDNTMAGELLKNKLDGTEYVIADKGYDDDKIRDKVKELGAESVIPYRSNRKNPRPYDVLIYGARHAVENCFSKLKQFRSLACRFDKTALSYSAMVTIGCILTWARL